MLSLKLCFTMEHQVTVEVLIKSQLFFPIHHCLFSPVVFPEEVSSQIISVS